MRSVAAVLCAIAAVSGANAGRFAFNDESWKVELDLVDLARMDMSAVFNDWKSDFGRAYESIEEEYTRFAQWVSNLQRIAAYNSDTENSAKLRLNQFGDWTEDEWHAYVHGCYKGSESKSSHFTIGSMIGNAISEAHLDSNPSSVDWTKQGVVTPVKNQGQCGSCWAFSTTGAIECRYAIAHGQLNSLSEQQLVDCSGSYGNNGCNGGLMDDAFKYVEHEGGLCSESEYPYTARDGTCKANTCGTKYDRISSYRDVTADSESSLETATAAGCVSVAIEADQFAFQYYSSGVLTGTCGTRLDHGVLVVGYGTEGNQEYWKVKNSWGESWGEDGYVLICRNCDKNGKKGECGILMEPSYPIA